MISEKHILRINSHGYGTSAFLEHTSAGLLSEYRVIIINPISPLHIMPSLGPEFGGITETTIASIIQKGCYTHCYDVDSQHFSREFHVRLQQLIKFLARGGLLICFLQPRFVFESSGSAEIGNYDWLPHEVRNLFSFKERYKGKEIVLTDKGHGSSFARYLKLQELSWDTCVTGFPAGTKVVSTLAVNEEKDPISFAVVYEKGRAVFLPVCSNFTQDIDELLIECVDKEYTSMTFEEEPADTWVEKYYIPGMPKLEEEIKGVRGEIEELKQVETVKGKELKELKSYRDILLNKKGHVLQNTVIEILNKMGIQAQPGPEGRDDIVIKEGDKVVVVCEVKGDKKSAAERDATQLSKWVDRVFVEEKYVPKGILIVNAFNEKDIPERTEKPFPDQILPYCLRGEYCLLTTVQLFNIFCEWKRGNITDGNTILKDWIECKGIYSKYQDIGPNLIEEDRASS